MKICNDKAIRECCDKAKNNNYMCCCECENLGKNCSCDNLLETHDCAIDKQKEEKSSV